MDSVGQYRIIDLAFCEIDIDIWENTNFTLEQYSKLTQASCVTTFFRHMVYLRYFLLSSILQITIMKVLFPAFCQRQTEIALHQFNSHFWILTITIYVLHIYKNTTMDSKKYLLWQYLKEVFRSCIK